MKNHLLYRYLEPSKFLKRYGFEHKDPTIDEFTYGEGGGFSDFVRTNIAPGSYIFFHATLGGQRYITAYYIVSKVMAGYQARQDETIKKKYRNPHIHPNPEWWDGEYNPKEDVPENINDVVIFGDPEKSRDLRNNPLPFDRRLAEKLDLNGKPIRFEILDRNGRTMNDNACINSCTRRPRILSKEDAEFLLREIENFGAKSPSKLSIGENEIETEVEEPLPNALDLQLSGWGENDIEDMIYQDPTVLGKGVQVLGRQYSVPSGRIDLLLEDAKGTLIITEIKKGFAPDQVVTQLLAYRADVRELFPEKAVVGAIICEECSARVKKVAQDNNIHIYYYGARFKCDKVI